MPKYDVAFCDDKVVTKEAPTADDAKRRAKLDRAVNLPPDTPKSAPEMKVARVTRVD